MKIKSGYQTSEFWLSLVATALPVLVVLGVLSPEQADTVGETASSAITELFELLAIVIPAGAYTLGRSWVKAKS